MVEQEKRSGVTYQEVQRAHAEEIMGESVHGVSGAKSDSDSDSNKKKSTRDRLHLHRPKASNSDDEGDLDSDADEEVAAMQEKRRRFEAEAKNVGLEKFNDVDGDRITDSVDSIAKGAMLGEPKPSDELWNKAEPDTERENFIQEELYPHDKVLIVDDRIVICGSSNINDRSQLGYHDSELSIVMEDTNLVDSVMNGQRFKAGHHAATLRRMLWREHLGLLPAQRLDASEDPNAQPPGDCDNDIHADGDQADFYKFVEDPLNDELWELWTKQATINTEVFRALFHADPDDNITSFDAYQKFLPDKAGLMQGHLFNPYMPVEEIKKALDKIRGHLVWFPLEFLRDAQMAERGLSINAYTESIYT